MTPLNSQDIIDRFRDVEIESYKDIVPEMYYNRYTPLITCPEIAGHGIFSHFSVY